MILTELISQWQNYRAMLVQLGAVRESTHSNQAKITRVLTMAAEIGPCEVTELRKSKIELYAARRLQTCKPVTVSAELDLLKQILAWAIDEKIITEQERPRFPTISVPSEEVPLPSEAAFSWILRRLPHHHAQALEMMMLTGLAPHELERLQTRDMGPKPGSMNVAGYPFEKGLLIGMRADFLVKQPCRKAWIPLNGRAALIWQEGTMGTAPDFHPFPTAAGMQKAMKRVVRKRGLNDPPPEDAEHVTPKTMRKWFASAVASEQPEHVLQRLMRHAPGSPITRKHYVRSTDEQLVGAVGGLKA